jgi:hypothetical protein
MQTSPCFPRCHSHVCHLLALGVGALHATPYGWLLEMLTNRNDTMIQHLDHVRKACRHYSPQHPLPRWLVRLSTTHLPLLPELRQEEHVRRFRSCWCIWRLFSPCPFLGYPPAQIPDRKPLRTGIELECLRNRVNTQAKPSAIPASFNAVQKVAISRFSQRAFKKRGVLNFQSASYHEPSPREQASSSLRPPHTASQIHT